MFEFGVFLRVGATTLTFDAAALQFFLAAGLMSAFYSIAPDMSGGSYIRQGDSVKDVLTGYVCFALSMGMFLTAVEVLLSFLSYLTSWHPLLLTDEKCSHELHDTVLFVSAVPRHAKVVVGFAGLRRRTIQRPILFFEK